MRMLDMLGGSTDSHGGALHNKHTAEGQKDKSVTADAGIEPPTSRSRFTRLAR
jgi:hypothetical protein